MKKILQTFFRWVGVFLLAYIVGTGIFILLFHTPIAKNIHVLMYRGIILLILSALIVFIGIFLIHKYWIKAIDIKDSLLMTLTFCCINMVLFTLIPVTVERSVSVFMLSYMSDHKKEAYTEEEMEDVFIKYYVEEYGAFQKRFEEQKVTGTVKEITNGYVITERGEFIVDMFRIVGKLFDTDQRLLYSNSFKK